MDEKDPYEKQKKMLYKQMDEICPECPRYQKDCSVEKEALGAWMAGQFDEMLSRPAYIKEIVEFYYFDDFPKDLPCNLQTSFLINYTQWGISIVKRHREAQKKEIEEKRMQVKAYNEKQSLDR